MADFLPLLMFRNFRKQSNINNVQIIFVFAVFECVCVLYNVSLISYEDPLLHTNM